VAHEHGSAHIRLDAGSDSGRLTLALGLIVGFMVVEVAAGVIASSLALLSDAGHMLADAGALALALVAQRVATRPRTHRRTYGSRRAETLAAFTNAIFLGVASVWVIAEAVERWRQPLDIKGGWMLGVAAGVLVVNLAAARLLAGGVHNENTRAALAHVLSDAAGSVAAMIAALLVLGWGWRRADPLISVGLAVLIFWSAWRLVARTLDVLMEGTPAGLAAGELERTIRETPGVAALHGLHAWSISEGFEAVTVHVVLDGTRHGTEVARDVSDRIRERHGIEHATVQPEAGPAPVSFQSLAGLKGKRP